MTTEERNEQLVHEICRRVGYFGNLVSMSKSGYRDAHPNNLVVFNANIILEDGGKIWFGDIDITNSGKTLMDMANGFGVDIYILHEMDARFENENNPKIEKFVIKFNQDNTYELSPYLKERDHGFILDFNE